MFRLTWYAIFVNHEEHVVACDRLRWHPGRFDRQRVILLIEGQLHIPVAPGPIVCYWTRSNRHNRLDRHCAIHFYFEIITVVDLVWCVINNRSLSGAPVWIEQIGWLVDACVWNHKVPDLLPCHSIIWIWRHQVGPVIAHDQNRRIGR